MAYLTSTEIDYDYSPDHPNEYPNNVDCKWNITSPNGEIITLEFVEFDVRHM